MAGIKFQENFVTTLHLLDNIAKLDIAQPTVSVEQLTTIQQQLKLAQKSYAERAYEDAAQSYKTAQSLIFKLLYPNYSIIPCLASHGLLLPVGKEIEQKLAEASLLLAETAHSTVQPLSSTVKPLSSTVPVSTLELPPELGKFAEIGFSANTKAETQPRDSTQKTEQTQTWQLGIQRGGEVVKLVWEQGQRPAADLLIKEIYKTRLTATRISDLGWKLIEPADTIAYLTHLYAFVIPQALGDCYHELGYHERAEQYYIQASQYSYMNASLEAPKLWIKMANNALEWGDRLYKEERIEECTLIYAKLMTQEGKAPKDSPLYNKATLSKPVAEALKLLDNLADPAKAGVNPAIAMPLLTVWARWLYLNANLDFYGTTLMPLFTFEYLQQAARNFAQQAISAEREYINFQVLCEAETAARRELETAVAMAKAEKEAWLQQYRAAYYESQAMDEAVELANLRVTNAKEDRDNYEDAGWWQYYAQSVATAHSAGVDYHSAEIRALANDIESGSWTGKAGKLAAAATLLGGQKSYEYQLERMQNTIEEMEAMAPIARDQARAAYARAEAAKISSEAAGLRYEMTRDALAAFDNEVFTPELWAQMAKTMLSISRGYQDWAIRAAKLMQRAYNFETDNYLNTIRAEYSSGLTYGLLGSDMLMQDIDSFTYHYITHQRLKESHIKDVISLSKDYPLHFQQFLQTGTMTFETTLRDFDSRHPGFYSQRLQAVELEVIGLLPPEGIRGTLRGGLVSRYRTASGAEKTRVHTVDTLALSEYEMRNDAFVYRTDPRLHGPFEGNGVAATWYIDLPRRSNNLDYRLIADVRLVLYYSAQFDIALKYDILARQPAPGEMIHGCSFLPKYDFPEAWYSFLDCNEMRFNVSPPMLPRNEQQFAMDKLALRFITKEGVSPAGIGVTLSLPGQAPLSMITDENGEIAAAPGNPLNGVMGGALAGEWAMSLTPQAGSELLFTEDGGLQEGLLEQIALIAQYRFAWQ